MNLATAVALIVTIAVLAVAAYGCLRRRDGCSGDCSNCGSSQSKPMKPCDKE